MLCHNQQCSYTHWIVHANYDTDNNKKTSRSQDKRFIIKKHAVVDKILNEFKQTQSCEDQLTKVLKDRDLKDCILIPKDPTAPYAFTVNPYTINKQKKKYFINQVAIAKIFSQFCRG